MATGPSPTPSMSTPPPPPRAPDSPRSHEIRRLRLDLNNLATMLQPLIAAWSAGALNPSTPPSQAPAAATPAPPPVARPTVGLKPAKPAFFSGKAKDVNSWIDSMQSHLVTSGLAPPFADVQVIVWAASFLSNTAKDWWLARKHQAHDDIAAGFKSFEEFADALTKHLADPFPEATADAAMATMHLGLYKGALAIRSFCADFLKLSVDLPNRDMQDLIRDFLRKLGSNKPLQTHLITPYPSSLQDAIDRALQYDSIINGNAAINSAPGNRSSPAPMELGSMEASTSAICKYCKKPGHWVKDCMKLKAKKAAENAITDPKGKQPVVKN